MRETYFWELWTTMYRVFLFSCVIFTLVKDEFCQDKTSVRGLGFALHIMYVDFNNKSSYNIMTIFCFFFYYSDEICIPPVFVQISVLLSQSERSIHYQLLSYFTLLYWLAETKCTEIWCEKVPDLSHFGTI